MGGRRQFFRRLMREFHTPGEFDLSIFPKLRLSLLPLPEEVREALEIELPFMPELD